MFSFFVVGDSVFIIIVITIIIVKSSPVPGFWQLAFVFCLELFWRSSYTYAGKIFLVDVFAFLLGKCLEMRVLGCMADANFTCRRGLQRGNTPLFVLWPGKSLSMQSCGVAASSPVKPLSVHTDGLPHHHPWCHYPRSPRVLPYHHPWGHYSSSQSCGVAASSPAQPLSVLLGGLSHYHPWCHYPCSPVGPLPHHCIHASCAVAGLFYVCDFECLGYDFSFSIPAQRFWPCLGYDLVTDFSGFGRRLFKCVCYGWFMDSLVPTTTSLLWVSLETWNWETFYHLHKFDPYHRNMKMCLCFLMFCFLPCSQHTVRLGGFSCSMARNVCN